MVRPEGLAHTSAASSLLTRQTGAVPEINNTTRGDPMMQIAIDTCPMCAATPNVTGRWRFQVRCACGACGPKMHTQRDAIARWSSVVRHVVKLRRELFPIPLMGHEAA